MARRKENDRAPQNNDDSDSNPHDELEDEPNFDDPEEYEDDISEQGKLFKKPLAIWLFLSMPALNLTTCQCRSDG